MRPFWLASMGPRSIDRGIIIGGTRYAVAEGQLQWGRDRSIAELVAGWAGCRIASRFNGAAIDRSRNCRRELAHVPPARLQWGRDRSIAELAEHEHAGEMAELQWGRDRSIAEFRPPCWLP